LNKLLLQDLCTPDNASTVKIICLVLQ
jgi:hypothetical protein